MDSKQAKDTKDLFFYIYDVVTNYIKDKEIRESFFTLYGMIENAFRELESIKAGKTLITETKDDVFLGIGGSEND